MKATAAKITESIFFSLLEGAHQALWVRGFRWETHRSGEVQIGLWRKEFRKKKPYPNRFVFIPGFGDTPLTWLTIFTVIEPILRVHFDEVVLLDLPGYNGRLVRKTFFSSVEQLTDALFDTLDSLKPHTVFGHSLGGYLTAQYAAACSTGKRFTTKKHGFADLQHAVVMSPSGYFETESERDEWVKTVERLIAEGETFWRPLIFKSEPLWFRVMAAPFFKFLSNEEIRKFLRSQKPEQEIRVVLPEIKSRVSLIWGEHDSLLPVSNLSGWLKNLNNTSERALGIIIKDTGHNPQMESPLKTATVLGQVLSQRKPHKLGKRWYELIE